MIYSKDYENMLSDYLKEVFPYSVGLPKVRNTMGYIDSDLFEITEDYTVRLDSEVYHWLETNIGRGSETIIDWQYCIDEAQALNTLVESIFWIYYEDNLSELDSETRRVVRFRNESDATLFKLTWL